MKRVQFSQIALASIVGIISGIYIFNPSYFVKYRKDKVKETALEAEKKNWKSKL